MSDKLGQVNNAVLDQADSTGPGVAVSVLELDVDLTDTGAHKGDVDLVLSNTNDEHLSAKVDGPDGSGDAALDTSALKSDRGLDSAKGLDNGLGRILRGSSLNLVGDGTRAELLGKLESALRDVGDDNGRCTSGSSALESDETDGSSTADQDGITQRDVGSVEASKSDTQRLEEGTVLIRHVANLVAPNSRVVDVSAQHTGNWGG